MSLTESSVGEPGAVESRKARWQRQLARFTCGQRPLFALFRAVGTQALIMLLNTLSGIIGARLLGPEGRGVYAAVTTWPPLLSALALAGLNSAIIVQMRKQPQASDAIAGASLVLALLHSLVAIVIGFLVMPFFMRQYPPQVLLFSQLCLVSVLVNSVQLVQRQVFAGRGEFSSCNLAQLMPHLLYLITLLLIMVFVPLNATIAVIALLGSGAAAVLSLVPRFIRVARPRFREGMAQLRALYSYGTRAAVMDVVLGFAGYADKLVLIPLLSAAELGFYAVAFSFSRVVQLVQPAIVSVFLFHLSGRTEEGGQRLHDQACRFLVAALSVGCVLLWVIGERLLTLAYGAEFSQANVIFQLLVIEASLGVLSQTTAQLLLSRDRPGVVSSIQALTVTGSTLTLLLVAPHHGAQGAALVLVGAGALRWLLLLGSLRFLLGLRLPRLYLNAEDIRDVVARLR